jgi:glycosyltransferase involved in cell wall biosynthesis
MPTVSLQMIVKDEFEAVASIVEEAIDYVDAVNLTVSDKTTANKLKKIAAGYNNPNVPRVTVVWRSWTDRFDEARNANLAMCKTDFFFWLDADDTFDFAAIPQLVEIAAKNNIDAIFPAI